MRNLHDKKFTLESNTAGNAVSGETVFCFEQTDNAVRVQYEGGKVQLGAMIGKFVAVDRLYVLFQQVTVDGQISAGEGEIAITEDAKGTLRFTDDWRFLINGVGGGRAIWVEVGG